MSLLCFNKTFALKKSRLKLSTASVCRVGGLTVCLRPCSGEVNQVVRLLSRCLAVNQRAVKELGQSC